MRTPLSFLQLYLPSGEAEKETQMHPAAAAEFPCGAQSPAQRGKRAWSAAAVGRGHSRPGRLCFSAVPCPAHLAQRRTAGASRTAAPEHYVCRILAHLVHTMVQPMF